MANSMMFEDADFSLSPFPLLLEGFVGVVVDITAGVGETEGVGEGVDAVGEDVIGDAAGDRVGARVDGELVVGESVVGESDVGESDVGESVVGESVVGAAVTGASVGDPVGLALATGGSVVLAMNDGCTSYVFANTRANSIRASRIALGVGLLLMQLFHCKQ